MSLVDGWFVWTNDLVAALDHLGLSAQESSANAADQLDAAWQAVAESLHVFVEGPKTTDMPEYFQTILEGYFEDTISAVDKEAAITSEQLTAIAAELKSKQEELYSIVQDNPRLHGLLDQYEAEMKSAQPDIDIANSLIEQINEILSSYNELREVGQEPLPLLPKLTAESLQTVRKEAETAVEALASMNTTDIYKGLAMAREEANGFAIVLKQLGTAEGQLTNLHAAVMESAQEMAKELGISDEAEIVKIGEELLEGLYDTYPGIAEYVDTSTGMLLDGWKEGIAEAINPWAELFESARLEDALKVAKRDMAELNGSALWSELLSPRGKGLYQYAEDWARLLIPDGTQEEVLAQAQAFVEAFFSMFNGIDTTIMDADGRITTGMDGIIDTMRQAVYDAQAETSKIAAAYQSLHADSLARNEATAGLKSMIGLAGSGQESVTNAFEAMSAEAIEAITAAMPALIDKLHQGTATAADFEAAITSLKQAETAAGKDAWQEYFQNTAAGLKQQTTQWTNAMRDVIAEVSVAEDRASAFYAALMRLSEEGINITELLEQYGTLATTLLDGTTSADELYSSLARLTDLELLQTDLERTGTFADAVKAIDSSNEEYDPLYALDAYALLEAEYEELTKLQRGSAEYLLQAKRLTQETTAAVYEQAAAYGVVSELQAKSARAAAAGQKNSFFSGAERNNYAGCMSFLADIIRQAEGAGRDIVFAWNDALAELDEAGHLEAMSSMFGDISNLATECGGNVEEIIARLRELRQEAQDLSLSEMAQNLRDARVANFAGTDSYYEQIESLVAAFGDGGIQGVQAAMEAWNGFDEALQQSIAQTYPSLVIALDDANQEAQALAEGISELGNAQTDLEGDAQNTQKRIEILGKELDSAQKGANARYFTQTARAIEDLKDGAIDVTDAFGKYNAEADAAVKANEQYQKAAEKMANHTQVAADEIDVLAEYLGNIDPNVLLQNWDMVGPMITAALAEGEAAFHRLNEAAFITITGTSVADFSALTNGLISVQNLAADVVQALIATGQWQLETITMPQEGAQWNPVSGVWSLSRLNTNQTVLRYTGSNPLRRSSSGSSGGSSGSRSSGGGSGGSSSVNVSESIQKALDQMDSVQEIEDHRRKMTQLAQGYHEARGEIQGVILYLEKEKGIVEDNSTSLRRYIDTLDQQIQKKQAELAGYKEGSKNYQQAMVDLEALQSAHQEYSRQL